MSKRIMPLIPAAALILMAGSVVMAGSAVTAAAAGTETEAVAETAAETEAVTEAVTEMQDGAEDDVLRFETTDIFGEEISSEDLFADHAYTMVNIWASWCGPCIAELPELAAMNGELEEDECGIVGLLIDGYDPEGVEEAKELMEAAGVDYPVLIPCPELEELIVGKLEVMAVPTSFYVDREGRIAGETIVGALPEQYREQFEKLLEEADA